MTVFRTVIRVSEVVLVVGAIVVWAGIGVRWAKRPRGASEVPTEVLLPEEGKDRAKTETVANMPSMPGAAPEDAAAKSANASGRPNGEGATDFELVEEPVTPVEPVVVKGVVMPNHGPAPVELMHGPVPVEDNKSEKPKLAPYPPGGKEKSDELIDLKKKGDDDNRLVAKLEERVEKGKELLKTAREALSSLVKSDEIAPLNDLTQLISANCRDINTQYLECSDEEKALPAFVKLTELNEEASQLGEAGAVIGDMRTTLLELRSLANKAGKPARKRRSELKKHLDEQFGLFEEQAFRAYRPMARIILNEAEGIK